MYDKDESKLTKWFQIVYSKLTEAFSMEASEQVVLVVQQRLILYPYHRYGHLRLFLRHICIYQSFQ